MWNQGYGRTKAVEEPGIGRLTIHYTWIFHCAHCHVQGQPRVLHQIIWFEWLHSWYIEYKEVCKNCKGWQKGQQKYVAVKTEKKVLESKTGDVFWFCFTCFEMWGNCKLIVTGLFGDSVGNPLPTLFVPPN